MTDSGRRGHSLAMLAVARNSAADEMDSAPTRGSAAAEHLFGVASSIDDIFQEHADFVWRALCREGLSDADAEDALQDVFVIVHRRLGEYEERGLMRAWLVSISRQVAGHYRRGATRQLRKAMALAETDAMLATAPDDFARVEAAAFVRSFLAQLEPAQAEVFELIEIEEMTAPEVAAALGIKLNTVYSRLRLARKKFEQMATALDCAGERP